MSDARVPCPLCGGLIHPVAGRCKHCKSDLTPFRAGRPQAAAALPPLLNGHHVAPVALPVREESAPILPPRPTGRSMPAQPVSMWRRWPVIVIVLAALAIIGAIILMFALPSSADTKTSRALPPPPAPEHMETNPLPPPDLGGTSADPWAPRAGANDPFAGGSGIAPVPDLSSDDNDDQDTPAPQGGADFAILLGHHVCDRLATCGTSNQVIEAYCDTIHRMPSPGGKPRCAAGKRCLDKIDHLACGVDATDIDELVKQVPDCMTAIGGC
ncbi:MAG TPA: hypothetical protein VLX92_26990 [Kofleriaceae bacterium]|nr:hypothetical protein [Kofleriaceae bacterium]